MRIAVLDNNARILMIAALGLGKLCLEYFGELIFCGSNARNVPYQVQTVPFQCRARPVPDTMRAAKFLVRVFSHQ